MVTQEGRAFWSIPADALLVALKTGRDGLSGAEAAQRLALYGPNRLRPVRKATAGRLFLAQFSSPIVLLLLFAAGLSFFLREKTSAAIIFGIVFLSGVLSFYQQHTANSALAKLLALVRTRAAVLRDGAEREVPVEEVVPGDIVILNAGDVVPGDALLLESRDLFVDEATLTGETFPAEKRVGISPAEAPLNKRTNALFMGTHVVSGTAKAVVVQTGKETEFGRVAGRLQLRPPETAFERGVRRFGYLLLEVTLLLVIAVFAINVYFHRPVLEAFLFSLALAVGLTPQLLPAIISVNLAQGARRMAREKVIVKRLAAIENFGSMDVLCSDKTGTLTKGVVRLHAALGVDGEPSEKAGLFAYLNAVYQTGFENPIDAAIVAAASFDPSAYRKLDEIPYDFLRKRLSVLVEREGRQWLITKGALKHVLGVSTRAEMPTGELVPLAAVAAALDELSGRLSAGGFRLLGVAYKEFTGRARIAREDEEDLIFLGLLLFYDPPKTDAVAAVKELARLGIAFKMITGDNLFAARYIWKEIGLPPPRVLTGAELRRMSSEALLHRATVTDIFAEVEPNQKERIILALRKAGQIVGYLGDGINDGPALHAADVGISVDTAADVAKEAADIVLLERGLGVLAAGVVEGRKTFANTLKYVFMATSANFGNMFSMAGASLFLPFLPLLPPQILLTNLLTDLPEMAIATDAVDEEFLARPRRWDIAFIRNFMLTFGFLSSVFDFLTFGVLLLMGATTAQFRTGWFQESVVSAVLIVLVIRTQHLFFRSRPGRWLLLATLAVVTATLLLPYTPLGGLFHFTPLPLLFLWVLGSVVILYVAGAEAVKRAFYRRVKF